MGSENNTYAVKIDILHPRKSKCNCPHADEKQIICKHMVAVYFTAFPEEAERIYIEAMAWEEGADKRWMEEKVRLMRCIHRMSKPMLEEALTEIFLNGSEHQRDEFILNYSDEDDF